MRFKQIFSIMLIGLLCFLSQTKAQSSFENQAYKELYRPQFHFSPKKSWMNDPNGLIFGSVVCRDSVFYNSHGAVLFYNQNLYYNSGFKIKVVDTVGSGDSFLAALLVQLLQNNSPQKAIDFACAVGAIVAQYEGANPEINIETIDKFCNPF